MTAEKQRRTFISYSRVNKEFAVKLAKELRADGHPIWLDQLDIPTGSRWDNELERALEECEIFLLILTPAAIASENVKDEIGYAIDNAKRILPVLLENCNVPLRLRRFQYVDFTTKNYDEGVESAKELLTNLINEATIPRGEIPAAFQEKADEAGAEHEAEEKLSAKETAARIVLRRTASNRYITEQASVIKASSLLAQGKQLSQNGDWEAAAQMFRHALELIPDHGETKTLLANVEAKILQEPEPMEYKIEGSDEPEVVMKSPEIISVQEIPVSVGQTQTRFSRRAINFGVLAFISVTGIISAAVWLTGKNSSSITSVGMVQVPSGSYTIGVDTVIELDEFWIDRYEITNSNYAKFIDESGTNPPEYWAGGEIPAGLREHPVAQIMWKQAKEYCSWAGKRLPVEAEWEVAARGPFGWKYPWGNDSDKIRQETRGTLPVDGNPANRSYFGAYYMSGNLWEWVDDPYLKLQQMNTLCVAGLMVPSTF